MLLGEVTLEPSGKPGIALGGQKCWETHRKPSNAYVSRNPGKPAESPVMLLGAGVLESLQSAK